MSSHALLFHLSGLLYSSVFLLAFKADSEHEMEVLATLPSLQHFSSQEALFFASPFG
jgi:hypothetical protein